MMAEPPVKSGTVAVCHECPQNREILYKTHCLNPLS